MSAQTFRERRLRYKLEYVLNALHDSRMLPGLFVSIALILVMAGQPASFGTLFARHIEVQSVVPAVDSSADTIEGSTPASNTTQRPLTKEMSAALDFAARRYHVSASVLEPVFRAAQQSARRNKLDPLLVVAVIAIESRFNPYAESAVGAQGLMQVVPRWHQDKIPEDMGEEALFDPEINVRVGAKILRESISREGGLLDGLQQYAGAKDDPEMRYANKVLAEKQRLEAAVARG